MIERSYDWTWKNQKGRDETTTDQNGEFSLPAIFETMIIGSMLPHDPSIDQTIFVRFGERSYQAWQSSKRNYDEFGELSISRAFGKSPGFGGKSINLICDLDDPVTNHGGVGGYGGIAQLRSD